MFGIVAHIDVLNSVIVVGCSCGYIFGYVFGIFGLLVLLLLIACYVFGLCHYNWEWLKKKEEVREKDDLKFGEPQNQQGGCRCTRIATVSYLPTSFIGPMSLEDKYVSVCLHSSFVEM